MLDISNELRINPDRMLAAFNGLAQIGATVDGGVNRPSFSEAHLAAHKRFIAGRVTTCKVAWLLNLQY